MSREGSLSDPNAQGGDALDRALRPQTFEDYVGQRKAKANLKVYVEAARGRAEALDHVLLFGPPGLARQRWRRSWRAKWASASARRPVL